MHYSRLLIAWLVTFSLTSCYEFNTKPLPEDGFVEISSTFFGRQMASEINDYMSNGTPSSQASSMFKNGSILQAKGYFLNDDTVIIQEEKKGKYSLSLLMRNDSHIFACQFLPGDTVGSTHGLLIEKDNSSLGTSVTVNGTPGHVERFVKEVMIKDMKLCIGIPINVSDTNSFFNSIWSD